MTFKSAFRKGGAKKETNLLHFSYEIVKSVKSVFKETNFAPLFLKVEKVEFLKVDYNRREK